LLFFFSLTKGQFRAKLIEFYKKSLYFIKNILCCTPLFATKVKNDQNSNEKGQNSSENQQTSSKKPLFDRSLKSGVYLITCLPLDKHYIGISDNVRARINAHKSALRRNCHDIAALQADYNEHKQGNFLFQKLLVGAGWPKEALEKLEVAILLTLSPEKRYNKYTDWRKRDPETNPFLGQRHTLEARQAQSEANQGRKSSFAGHEQSNTVKQLISQQNKGTSSQERRKDLYIDSVYYESISQASELTKYSRKTIRDKCNNPKCDSFKWAMEYEAEEQSKQIEEQFN
jgi:hypothetical protein